MTKNTLKAIIMSLVFFILTIGIASTSMFSQSGLSNDDVKKIIDDLDEKFAYEGDFKAIITLTQLDEGKQEPAKIGELYRNDKDDEFLFIFKAPPADNGNGYLYKEGLLIFYDKQSGKFSQITDSEAFGGTDSRSRDLENESNKYGDNFTFTYEKDENIGDRECYVFKGVAKRKDIENPIIRMWVTKKGNLPLKQKEYSLEERLSRTADYLSFKKCKDYANKRYFLAVDKLIVTNEKKKDTKTTIEFTNISTEDVPDNIFSKDYLKNQS